MEVTFRCCFGDERGRVLTVLEAVLEVNVVEFW